jgi:hypothetical protein
MAEAHVVQVNLIKFDQEGNVLDGKSTIGARTEFSTEHRVMMNANVPNTFGEDSEGNPIPTYPTIESFIVAEAADGFILQHMDQFTIVTTKP